MQATVFGSRGCAITNRIALVAKMRRIATVPTATEVVPIARNSAVCTRADAYLCRRSATATKIVPTIPTKKAVDSFYQVVRVI